MIIRWTKHNREAAARALVTGLVQELEPGTTISEEEHSMTLLQQAEIAVDTYSTERDQKYIRICHFGEVLLALEPDIAKELANHIYVQLIKLGKIK